MSTARTVPLTAHEHAAFDNCLDDLTKAYESLYYLWTQSPTGTTYDDEVGLTRRQLQQLIEGIEAIRDVTQEETE